VYLFEVLGAPDLEVVGGGVEGVQGVVVGDLVSVFSTSIGEGSSWPRLTSASVQIFWLPTWPGRREVAPLP
jgi:hypothetical protein